MFNNRDHRLLYFFWDVRFVILFYVLGDILTTAHSLQFGYEGNSFLSSIMDAHGIYGLMVLKILFLVVLFWYYYTSISYGKKWTRAIWTASRDSIAILGLILTISNLFVIYFGTSLFQLVGAVPSI